MGSKTAGVNPTSTQQTGAQQPYQQTLPTGAQQPYQQPLVQPGAIPYYQTYENNPLYSSYFNAQNAGMAPQTNPNALADFNPSYMASWYAANMPQPAAPVATTTGTTLPTTNQISPQEKLKQQQLEQARLKAQQYALNQQTIRNRQLARTPGATLPAPKPAPVPPPPQLTTERDYLATLFNPQSPFRPFFGNAPVLNAPQPAGNLPIEPGIPFTGTPRDVGYGNGTRPIRDVGYGNGTRPTLTPETDNPVPYTPPPPVYPTYGRINPITPIARGYGGQIPDVSYDDIIDALNLSHRIMSGR